MLLGRAENRCLQTSISPGQYSGSSKDHAIVAAPCSIIGPVMIDQGTVKGSLLAPLLAGASVLAVTLFGLVNLTSSPALRPALLARPIVGIDSYEIRDPSDIPFALSRKGIGDPVEVRFGPDGGPAVVRDTVVRFYAQRPFPLALVMLGGVSFLSGFVVLLFRPRDRRSRIFFSRYAL